MVPSGNISVFWELGTLFYGVSAPTCVTCTTEWLGGDYMSAYWQLNCRVLQGTILSQHYFTSVQNSWELLSRDLGLYFSIKSEPGLNAMVD